MGNGDKGRPLKPKDFFADADSSGTLVAGNNAVRDTRRTFNFDTSGYNYLDSSKLRPGDDPLDLGSMNTKAQPYSDKIANMGYQLGANIVSSMGQGLANTFDLASNYKTIKNEITGGDDDFNSSLFGLTTKEMQDWATGIAQRNPIYEDKEGAFDPTDSGWWAKQIASSGTGIGMAFEALASTAAIEYFTGGIGTAAAFAKLGSLGKKILSGAKGAEMLHDAVSAAKGMKSAATMYGIISRTSESRMEAMQSYDDIYSGLTKAKKKDGTSYTEAEKKHYASEGARRTFNGNMALLPLDILGFRTMVYNPISGAGEGLIEKTLGKIGNKYARNAVQFGVEAGLEGTEELAQYVAQQEGSHYANVLAGLENESSFVDRVNKDLHDDEAWNNFAGGVIGSPIIGGAMKITNRIIHGNKSGRLNDLHDQYIKSIGKMDNAYAVTIKKLESEGQTEKAAILRKQLGASKVLGALHLDAQLDKDSAFETQLAFVEGVLGELNEGKTDALADLGFHNTSSEQLGKIKEEFTNYVKDAHDLKRIYDNVAQKYNRNFVPSIAQDHFELERVREEGTKADIALAEQKASPSVLAIYNSLTSRGKELHDINDDMWALQRELKLLNSQYISTTNSYKKDNIDRQIKETQDKLTKAKQKLDEINKDTSYETIDRNKDADIINARLTDYNYMNALANKARTETQTSLKAKDVALWNKHDYMKSKMQEALNHIQTKTQADDLAKQAGTDTEIKDAANEKKEDIEIKEANTTGDNTQGDPNDEVSKSVVNGNSGIFDGIDDAIDGLVSQSNVPSSNDEVLFDDNLGSGRPPVALFAPDEYDMDKSSDEVKQRLKNGVKIIIDGVGGDSATFEDVVRRVISGKGLATADKIFNALKYGWEANGKASVDYNDIYDKIFGLDELVQVASQLVLSTKQEIQEVTDKEQEKIIAKQEPVITFDSNNRPVVEYKGVVTNESSPAMAFSTMYTRTLQTVKDDGTIEISHEYVSQDLNPDNHIDSLPLLDPDEYNGGTQLHAIIPDNFLDIRIPMFDALGKRIASIPFGQLVANKGLSPSDQEYMDKIPMILYDKGKAKSGEKGRAFIHDVEWYNDVNFNQNKPEDREAAITATRAIRKEILDNGKTPTDITITSKRQTTFAGLKIPVNQDWISLKEANPQMELTVSNSNKLVTGKRKTENGVEVNVAFPNGQTELINTESFFENTIYDVRRYGMKDGKKTFLASPVTRPELAAREAIKQTVLNAIAIYDNKLNQDPAKRAKHDAVVKEIKDKTGLDILDKDGLINYLRQFINVFGTTKANETNDVVIQAESSLAKGTPYIAFTSSGNLVFGQAGETLYKDSNGNLVKAFFINPNSAKDFNGAAKLTSRKWTVTKKLKDGTVRKTTYNNLLDWFQINLDFRALDKNKPVIGINNDGTTSTLGENYKDFLLNNLQTNIRSINIGTEEKPNYVTNIQPVITYDTNKRLSEQGNPSKETTTEKAANQGEGLSANTSETGNSQGEQGTANTTEDEQKLAEKLLNDLNNKLGNQTGVGKKRDFLAPEEMTEQERNHVTDDIERIAGLTPNQQFDVVDYMFNQVTSLINLDNKVADKKEIEAAVEKAFNDHITPIKQDYNGEIARLEEVFKQFPNLLNNSQLTDRVEDFKFLVERIEAIEANIDLLKREALEKVYKYTGITESSVLNESKDKDESEAIDDGEAPEEGGEMTIDFWTDVLQESPENKLTYSMRRFLGNISELDKHGNPVTGFLGLPKYLPADEVIRTLMVHLADVPSNFETMMAKLNTLKEGRPWMAEVIKKLEDAGEQKKNQFVTVMSNTKLRMKFSMIGYNRKSQTWSTKVYDTHKNGVADMIEAIWKDNLMGDINNHLVLSDEEGNHILNLERARHLINIFDNWKGKTLPILENRSLLEGTIDNVRETKPQNFKATGVLLDELNKKLTDGTSRVKTTGKGGRELQIMSIGKDNYQISYLQENAATVENVRDWLKEFGIVLSDETMLELKNKGMYHNYARRDWNELFDDNNQTNGIFGILRNKLQTLVNKPNGIIFDEEGDEILDDSAVSTLANLEANYNDVVTPFGFRDNGKSFFALTAPKFITDRVRDLKDPNSNVKAQIEQISFSNPSLWLKLMNDDKFRDRFNVSHIGANAIKEMGKKLYRDNSIMRLSDVDHELTKLGMFWDSKQGEVSMEYPGTNIPLRMATMFSPTMSDKSTVTLITTAVLNLKSEHLGNGGKISDELSRVIYEQTVKPELLRMLQFHKNKANGTTYNINGYENGASMFMLMPEMNNLETKDGIRLIKAIEKAPHNYSIEKIENDKDLMAELHNNISSYVNKLVAEKMNVWTKNGYITPTEEDTDVATSDNEVEQIKFFDSKYLSKFTTGNIKQRIRMAAQDFVINSMIANANSFMTMAGDPAMYFKSKEKSDYVQMAKDSFVNVGKRLANQIAPGTTLANSENEQYLHIFLEDRISAPEPEYLKFLSTVADGKEMTDNDIKTVNDFLEAKNTGKPLSSEVKNAYEEVQTKYPKSAGFFELEGSNAQEYTTWKEHLDILSRLGKTPDNIMDVSPAEIQEARELFSNKNIKKSDLTEKQMKLISKVMQPIKPVYTGQIYDKEKDVMRTVYIKTSSFPLIPQLTEGFELDKLRNAMERIETKEKKPVRASYQSGNKVGSPTTTARVWNNDGTINNDGLNEMVNSTGTDRSSSLVLDRKNFRIQQEVPFKSGKNKEDKITLMTQMMKMLFGDEMMSFDGFEYNGRKLTGRELHKIYNDSFIDLVKEKKNQLFRELGLDLVTGMPIDARKSQEKLQQILKDEATKRGYPLQDIKALRMTDSGDFNLPLWSSSNSNRYESMLNSIVTNRIIKMKFPGNSYVAGSEEGFIRTKKVNEDNTSEYDKSKIVYTSAWNGRSLQATYYADGKLKKGQVFCGSKFRDRQGNLIDLLTKENGAYKYIDETETGFLLKNSMFDKELLSQMTIRIPTSGHQSGSQIEIAGFLPHQNADLMIVPRNITAQKGLDFDVDKETAYQFWHIQGEDGKFEVLSEKHRNQLLTEGDNIFKARKLAELRDKYLAETAPNAKAKIKREFDSLVAEQNLWETMMPEIGYMVDIEKGINEIADAGLEGLNSKITEKLLQNEIIKIHHSVFGNPDPKVQAKIHKFLGTNFAEEQAAKIEKMVSGNSNQDFWTPLSDEYQKGKMGLGASGKIGTGAYSLDVVFHSLAQQSAMNGNPITIYATDASEDGEPVAKVFRFGDYASDGQLGKANTISGFKEYKGDRSISEVQAERQNIAVDNEKLQVMGRVNLNDLTLDVDKLFNLLGFDKGEDGNSIAMLFLSQPIIKEYVEAMKNSTSNMADYVKNREATLVQQLSTKYNPEGAEILDRSIDMTNAKFVYELKSDKPDGLFQIAVLKRFLEMDAYGKAVRNIQTTINVDSKGLGKSFFDVIQRRNALNKLASDASVKAKGTVEKEDLGFIRNAKFLIGDFRAKKDMGAAEMESLQKQGYMDIGDNMVLPTTQSGAFNIVGVATAYNTWSKYFPYDASITVMAFDEILPIIGNDDMTDSKTVELKQMIFKGMKKYFSASKKNGIISTTDDINAERKRLYIDSEENMSLAKYIKALKSTVGNDVVDTFIKTNKLINRFEFDIKKNGEPSKIKFNNAAGEDFDEQYLYESLATLMEMRGPNGKITLPKIGNVQHTLDSLAQDLIAYSMLGNATQEAIQFTKYIPVSYLDIVKPEFLRNETTGELILDKAGKPIMHTDPARTRGYAHRMRLANHWLETNQYVLGLKVGKQKGEEHLVSEYTMQFIQHNPERVTYKDVTAKDWKDKVIDADSSKLETLKSFKLKSDDRPTFISIYNPSISKGEKKFQLYWWSGEKYERVPVLGTFGMDEYQPGSGIGQSIVNGREKPKAVTNGKNALGTNNGQALDPFNVAKGSTQEVLASIVNSKIEGISAMAKELMPYVGKIKIQFADSVTVDGQVIDNFRGHYNSETNTITIKSDLGSKVSTTEMARKIVHEIVHGLTVNQISQYIISKADGTVVVKAGAPAHVMALVRLYNDVREKSGKGNDAFRAILDKVRTNKGLSGIDEKMTYGLSDIYEFMSFSLTEPVFQEYLSKDQFKQSGGSLLAKFKEILNDILKGLGVNFGNDTATVQAINSIFEFIENTNNREDISGYDFDKFNVGEDNAPDDDQLTSGTEVKDSFSPEEFPVKPLNIQNIKCK